MTDKILMKVFSSLKPQMERRIANIFSHILRGITSEIEVENFLILYFQFPPKSYSINLVHGKHETFEAFIVLKFQSKEWKWFHSKSSYELLILIAKTFLILLKTLEYSLEACSKNCQLTRILVSLHHGALGIYNWKMYDVVQYVSFLHNRRLVAF